MASKGVSGVVTSNGHAGTLLALACMLLSSALLGACSDARTTDEPLGTTREAATALSRQAVFGFETAIGWSTNLGILSSTETHTEGKRGLQLTTNSYTEITSVQLPSLRKEVQRIRLDVRIPTPAVNPGWLGDVHLIVSVPSLGVHNQFVGQRSLNGYPPGQFATLSYDVPNHIGSRLDENYADLTFKIALNVPHGSGGYVFDNLRLNDDQPSQFVSDCHPYLRVLDDGAVTFQFPAPSARSAVELFVRKNGAAFVTTSILNSRTQRENGTFVYYHRVPAGSFAVGDRLEVRFRSRVAGGNDVYTPGPTASTWSQTFVYSTDGVCMPVRDRDADGRADAEDACPDDPGKKDSPGFCGCGQAETDSDTDGLPDCKDECRLDPSKFERGTCGCLNGDAAPAGTVCSDGVCPGTFTCNGAGRCGNPDSCRPAGTTGAITSGTLDGTVLIGARSTKTTFAQAISASPIEYRLVSGGTAEQNRLLASLIAPAGGGARVWMAARLTAPGVIRRVERDGSLGPVIWDASRTPPSVDHAFTNWEPNQPPATASSGCVSVGVDGKWRVEPCTNQQHAFYERSALTLTTPTHFRSIACSDFTGIDCTPPDGYADETCTPVDAVMPGTLGDVTSGVGDCEAACTSPGAPGCSACAGFATPPATSSTCDGETEPCSETKVCTVPQPIGDSDPRNDPDTNLTETVFDPQVAFGTPTPPVLGQYPNDVPAGSGANHTSCTYEPGTILPAKNVSDDKYGRAGRGSALTFDVDPNVTLNYALEPMASGEFGFRLDAAARLKASAAFDFAGATGTIPVIEAMIAAHADRCSYRTDDSKLELFGVDFLPLVAQNLLVNSRHDHPEATARCEEAVQAFKEVASRAKKAMRDTQDLLRQYHEGIENGTCFDVDLLCERLVTLAPPGFPKVACDDLTVEDVINLQIHFYERQLDASLPRFPELRNLPDFDLPSLPKDPRLPNPSFTGLPELGDLPSLGSLPDLSSAPSSLSRYLTQGPVMEPRSTPVAGCEGASHTEQAKLLELTFLLGPIPMLLEVNGILRYGLDGSLDFDFNRDALLSMGTPGERKRLVSVGAHARPCASAGVAIFVGAGISGFGFRASAGVDGNVTLGTVTMPAHATAHISAASEKIDLTDTLPGVLPNGVREVAEELKGLWSGEVFPMRRYHVYLGYDYGAKLQLKDVLKGKLSASLTIKFAWFKKRWRTTLVNFGETGATLADINLFKGSDSAVASGSFPWGSVDLPDPFVRFKPLKRVDRRAWELDVPDLVSRGLDLGSLELPDLGRLGFQLDELDMLTIPRATLPELGRLLKMPDLEVRLSAQGLDLNALRLSDFARIGLGLGDFGGFRMSQSQLEQMNFNTSQLIKLGLDLGDLELGDLPDPGFSCNAELDTSRVGDFFYDKQCRPAAACQPETCEVDLARGGTDCGGDIGLYSIEDPACGGPGDPCRVTMRTKLGECRELVVEAEICDPSGMVLNIGDSPSNNGNGGDALDFRNDAELTLENDQLSVFGRDFAPTPLLWRKDGFAPRSGCTTQTFVVSNRRLSASGHVLQSDYLYGINQPDDEGGPDDLLWVGLNRAIRGEPLDLTGSGLRRARLTIR